MVLSSTGTLFGYVQIDGKADSSHNQRVFVAGHLGSIGFDKLIVAVVVALLLAEVMLGGN